MSVAQAASLALDVDTPGDLAALRAALAARPGAAPRTRAVLMRLAPVDRLTRPVSMRGCRTPPSRSRDCPRSGPGDDLAALLAAAAARLPSPGLQPGDVLAVAHKVVSKAEGRVRRLADVTPGARARALGAASTARTRAWSS